MSTPAVSFIKIDGLNVFYRSAGPEDGPVVLLLHGFPSSSHQFRNLIRLLAQSGYRVIAPDLPGFGFTEVPKGYSYTFDNLSKTTESFVDALKIKKFAVYIFDYGAPTALRLALRRPELISAIITQNGNAYEEGFGDFWAPIRKYWESDSQEDRDALRPALLTFDVTKFQYEFGTPQSKLPIAPETYTLDYALISRPGNDEVQLDLFRDYKNNISVYPQIQEYFRKSQVPLLGVWGKNDPIFIKEGLAPFKKDLPKAELHLLDAGHFAVESHTEEIAALITKFLKRVL